MVRLTDGSGRRVDYCPDCGVFNDLEAGRHLTRSDSAREDMNARLGSTARCAGSWDSKKRERLLPLPFPMRCGGEHFVGGRRPRRLRTAYDGISGERRGVENAAPYSRP